MGPSGDDTERFRIAVLAPLVPCAEYSVPHPDPDRADSAGSALRIEVPDPFRAGDNRLRVDLRLGDLASFRPDAIAPQVPALRALQGTRSLVSDLIHAGKGPEEALISL